MSVLRGALRLPNEMVFFKEHENDVYLQQEG